MDSHVAGNEYCVCRHSNVHFSNVECTGQFACIFGDGDRGVETKCLVLLQVDVLVKIDVAKSIKTYQHRETPV